MGVGGWGLGGRGLGLGWGVLWIGGAGWSVTRLGLGINDLNRSGSGVGVSDFWGLESRVWCFGRQVSSLECGVQVLAVGGKVNRLQV